MVWLRIAAVATAGLVLSVFDDWPAVTLISTALLVLTGVLFLWSRFALSGLWFERSIPSRSQVGDTITEHVTLRNRSVIGKLFVEIHDRSTLPGHLASRVVSMGPRTVRKWTITSRIQQRGHHVLGPVTLRSSDPLGFFRRARRLTETAEIVVYPLIVDLPGYEPVPLVQSGGGTVHRRSAVPTAAVGGVRDYTTGDSINVISWTATARAGRLMVKEFEVDPTSDVWIVLDVAATGSSSDGARAGSDNPLDWLGNDFEYRVMLTASLVRRVTTLGRAVGLVINSPGSVVIPPDRGERQFIRIQELLAVVSTTPGEPVGELLTVVSPRIRPNSTVIALTSTLDSSVIATLASLRGRRISSELIHVHSGSDLETAGADADRLMSGRIVLRELTRFDHPSSALRPNSAGRQFARRAG